MSDFRERIEKLSPKRLTLLALELQSRIEELERQRTEPIAIVGMGCRIPGSDPGLDGFWRVLDEGRDVISQIPADRWDAPAYFDPDPDAPGRMATTWGGFLADIAAFDAPFFGISRREAVSMDPQQRMLLEVCWEALEHAGYCPRQPAAGNTGVFVGMTTTDYHELMLERGEETVDVHTATGSGHSTATGRISYTLNLHGPNLAVDTACSASLVAIHLACLSLRSNECRMALAGGVNALLAPELFIALSKAHVLAPDGRCKAFDSRADGFTRAEGCGIVVLKRLSHAQADGDNILALIRGSALNQDGRSSGLTAPNGAAQEAVIKSALASGGVAPEDVDYVEAHGTGTALGDPIEAHALAAVLGANRTPDHPLVLGSVKTNMGHLESASGVTGLIKVVLSLQHGVIPRHLHFQAMNPHIDWKNMPFEIPVQPLPWKPSGKRRIAGLNSFGLSGTNAHVVIEEAPARKLRERPVDRPLHLLTLSARSQKALTALIGSFAEEMSRTQTALGDICYTAAAGRAHFDHRAAFVAATPDAMQNALRTAPAAAGNPSGAPQIVFLFPGQGSQYVGMSKELYDTQPAFRAALDECAELLKGELEAPLLEVLWQDSSPLLDQTAYTQPALFAVEYALAKLWMSWGIVPAAVLGHSVGEYVAACVAGIFSLQDGLKLIAGRARLMQQVSGQGGMAAAMTSEERVRRALTGLEDRVTIAALNAPANVVLSGYRSELDRALEILEKEGTRVQRLTVSHAFHSPQMREMEAAFEQLAGTIRFQPPALRFISSVTGREARQEMLQPAYWRRQVSDSVRFRDAIQTLEEFGYTTFLEVGPGTTLAGLGKQCVSGEESVWLPSLRKGRGEWIQMLGTLAQLYARGAEPDWAAFDKPYGRLRVPLPTYPFERQQYWFENRGESKRVPGHNARSAIKKIEERSDDWFYQLVWEPKEAPVKPAKAPGRCLIIPDNRGVATELGKKLVQELGATVAFAANPESAASLLARETFDAVVHVASMNQAPLKESASRQPAPIVEALKVTQVLLAASSQARLWLVTSNAQPISADDGDLNLLDAPLWGLGKTFGIENPESWGGLVDLDASATPAEMAGALFSAITNDDGEDEIAFRGTQRYVARLVRHNAGNHQAVFAADKTYLVTGGLGGLGLRLSSWMAANGARNLVLLGRKAPSGEAAKVLDALRERGVRVELHAADVVDKPRLSSLLNQIRQNMPPLAGVIHAAGVLDDGVIPQLNQGRLEKVLAPKVTGTWNLHELTSDLPLDFFVLFSSLASVTGSPGQASYAAANAFMDAFAHYRRAQGLTALSVNWGGWADAGMAARVDPSLRQRAGGFHLMPPDPALAALGRLLSGAAPQVTVAAVDWQELQDSLGRARISPLFGSMLSQQHSEDTKKTAAPQVVNLRGLPSAELRPRLVGYLRGALAPIFGVEESTISPGRPIVDFGLDSLMALEFRNRISADLNVTVSTANLLRGPSLEALAAEILPQLAKLDEGRTEEPSAKELSDYPLSFGQQTQWFGHKLAPDLATFNVAFTASISPCLDWKAFERAVMRLVDRHAALRTIVIEKDDGQPMQRVLASATPHLALVDVTGWPEEKLKERVLQDFGRAFPVDLPMVRITVYRDEKRRRDVLLIAVDHLIVDASSVQICFEDLRTLYAAELAGTEGDLKPLQAEYRDYVEWEANLAESPEADRLWSYWKDRLKGDLPILSLPSSQPRPGVVLPKGDSVALPIGPQLSAAVHRVAREHRTTAFSVLLAAYHVLLKAYCGQEDLIIGTSVSRRDDPRWANVMGLFVNVLALRADVSGDPTFSEHLAQTRESVLGAMAHQEFPFPLLVNRLRLPRSMERNPICQAFLNFLTDRSGDLGGLMSHGGDAAIEFGTSVLTPFLIIPQQEGQSDILLQLGRVEDQFVGNLSYNTQILDRATAETMAEAYREILENATRDPQKPLSELVPAGSVEREEILL